MNNVKLIGPQGATPQVLAHQLNEMSPQLAAAFVIAYNKAGVPTVLFSGDTLYSRAAVMDFHRAVEFQLQMAGINYTPMKD